MSAGRGQAHEMSVGFRERFGPGVEGYLDTPTMGLPTVGTVEAMRGALDDWLAGRADHEVWEQSTEQCRWAWAQLHGVDVGEVGTVPTVVTPIAAVLAAIASRTRGDVLVHRDEFRSVLLPALAAFGAERVRWVDGEYSADAFLSRLDGNVAAVALCSVASGNGARPDLTRIADAADSVGAALAIDDTQSEGIVGLGVPVQRLAVLAAAGYKGLLGPRGTGYVWAGQDLDLQPLALSPYGMADSEVSGFYGGPGVPYPGGRGLSQSPAWLAWVGAAPGLELLIEQPAQWEDDVLGLAARLRDGLFQAGIRVEPSDLPSPIVSVLVRRLDEVMAALAAAGVRTAVRVGRLRLGLHLYTSVRTIDTALSTLVVLDRGHYDTT